jgi:predicted phage terminase large subunit-like protein
VNALTYHVELLDDVATRCRHSLAFFARVFWPVVEPGRAYTHGRHIDAICEHLQAVTRRELRDLVIAMPPRHMKSLLVSVFWPTWVWTFQPNERWIFGSYAQPLSTRDAVKSRRIIQSSLYQTLFGHVFSLTGDQNQKTRYENDRTGYRIATSVDGGSTGEGGDVVVADDPIKATDGDREVVLQSTSEWFWGAMSTRSNDPKKFARVVVMQRLNERDTAGEAVDQGFALLKLPARYVGERIVTPLGWEDFRTEPGQLLWPERFNEEDLSKIERDLGARRAAGQLQQEPAPLDGIVFKREWWKYYKTPPAQFDAVCTSWDLTFKDGEKNDFFVGVCIGRKGADKYVLGVYRARGGFNDQLRAFRAFTAANPRATAHYVEDAANGAALVDTLKREISGIIPVKATTSKLNRAEAVAPQMEAGNVWLPEDGLWVQDFVEEHTKFPGGRNDDQVDATSQALAKLTQRKAYDMEAISMTKTSVWR